jgi:hypothetical protein
VDPRESAGAVSQAQAAYCVLDAHTDVGTVHFQGPDWLLASSEATGPLELNVRVQQYVQPALSTTVEVNLDPAAISKAVGYSLAERFEIQGGARRALQSGVRQRLEAYAAYQRTVWEIRDADCVVPLGMGASFKPIGVYFRVVDAAGITLPDLGFYTVTSGESPGSVSHGSPVAPAPPVQAGLGAAASLASPSACALERTTRSGDLGVAAEAEEVDYCILNVHTDEDTLHFEGPTSLLASVEGRGALKLDLRIVDFLIPTVSLTGHHKPKKSTISDAVGYSVQERHGFNEFTRLDVATGTFQRVEAYANYQRTVFDVFDASCGTLLEAGAAYRPIGVYFKAVFAEDVALPDIGAHVWVDLPDPPPPPPEPADARSSGARSRDAGAPRGDAGAAKEDAGAPTGQAGG